MKKAILTILVLVISLMSKGLFACVAKKVISEYSDLGESIAYKFNSDFTYGDGLQELSMENYAKKEKSYESFSHDQKIIFERYLMMGCFKKFSEL